MSANKLLIAQLFATRDTLLACVSQVETSLVALDVDPTTGSAIACEHPRDAIQDLSTMDDDGERYRCTKCGAESTTPFPSLPSED